MNRKQLQIAAGSGVILLLIAAGALIYIFRPVTIQDDGKLLRLRPHAWTVGQALYAAKVSLDPHDQVIPGLAEPLPLNGNIQIHRAVRALIWHDGQVTPINGMQRTPAELLQAAGISLAQDDRLLWNGLDISPNTSLPTNSSLVLQIVRAAPITIEENGAQQAVRSSASTAAQALWENGIRLGPGDRLSVDPGSPLAPGMTITHQPALALTISTQGRQIQIYSAATTVGAALAEANIALQGLDYSRPGEEQTLPADGQIQVVRVREEIVLKEALIPFGSEFAPDPELEIDLRQTGQAGQFGVQMTRERIRYEDGQEISRGLDSDWVAAEPQPQINSYGTKVVTRSETTPNGVIEYWRKIRVRATSYSPCRLGTADNRCSYTTASGMRLTKGVVAVSLSWFRMMRGQNVYIPGYGYGVIADYGGLSGMSIDLGFDEDNFEQGAIVGWVDLYFLTPIPASIPWTLP